ncbi:response regulator [Deinococcus radiotolerans]|uniref:Response regulator n=1 Tax=Deinococcus radiotolerans TaxID=1309407 RepID=A0ABQ2FI34_9DEIO|nr:response regulator [Deinococcus radiotolerans]GGL00627.1 response regulator [Deinococcus radiotolerans]
MTHRLLIVEDSDEDFTAIQWALNRLNRALPLDRCADGDAALTWLQEASNWPSLILLDLNLPGTDGREVLGALRRDARTRTLPVVVLSTSASARDINDCYALGANSYLTKPVNFAQFTNQLRLTLDFWLEAAQLPQAPEAP